MLDNHSITIILPQLLEAPGLSYQTYVDIDEGFPVFQEFRLHSSHDNNVQELTRVSKRDMCKN